MLTITDYKMALDEMRKTLRNTEHDLEQALHFINLQEEAYNNLREENRMLENQIESFYNEVLY